MAMTPVEPPSTSLGASFHERCLAAAGGFAGIGLGVITQTYKKKRARPTRCARSGMIFTIARDWTDAEMITSFGAMCGPLRAEHDLRVALEFVNNAVGRRARREWSRARRRRRHGVPCSCERPPVSRTARRGDGELEHP